MKSFCIIGLGKFGFSLAETLAKEGKQVLAIDADADKINAVADIVSYAVIGDATNEAVLREAGVADYDCAIICMTSNINDNILLTIMLKDLGIRKVVSRAINDGHRKVLEKIGADMIVFPENDMGEKLGFKLSHESVTEFAEFHGYQIVEIKLPASWRGKNLIDLEIRRKYGITVLAVNDRQGNVTVSPIPTRSFEEGDIVSVIGTEKDIEKLISQLG